MAASQNLIEKSWRAFIEQLPQGIACYEPEISIDLSLPINEILKLYFQMPCIDCNTAYASMHGYRRETMIGIRVHQFMIDNKMNRKRLADAIQEDKTQTIHQVELYELTKSGEEKYFHVNLGHEIHNNLLYRVWIHKIDVTAQKKLTKKLSEQMSIYRDLFENVSDDLFIVKVTPEKRFCFLAINPAALKNLQLSPDHIKGQFVEEITHEPLSSIITESFQHCLAEEKAIHFLKQVDFPSGSRFMSLSLFPIYNSSGRIHRIFGVARDITASKKFEQQLKQLNWILTISSRSNVALLHSKTELDLFQSYCDAIVSSPAYSLAFITKPNKNEKDTVDFITASSNLINLKEYNWPWHHIDLGNSYTKLAMESGEMQIHQVKLSNLLAPLQRLPILKQLVNIVVLPLKIEDNLIGTLNIFVAHHVLFEQEEIKLYQELADNLCLGIKTNRLADSYSSEIKLKHQQAIKLQKTLESALTALSNALSQRDPYTAGHQTRVSDLACAIAKEMHLDEERIHWLGLAANVHDIGKIHIPAEILSKPTHLTATEFELIKIHPEAGYEILKGIDFPAPVATIVRQHHEYLDGSGYPHGLKGDEILLETQIITVADIVESMSSHRPYRPALGIDAALAYIQELRGTKLCAQAVDACGDLFQKKNYRFLEQNSLHA